MKEHGLTQSALASEIGIYATRNLEMDKSRG